jgi:hypothetical protein
MTQSDLDQTCRDVYSETKEFYSEIAHACGNLGFKILYGPPIPQATILFIGRQPGGGAEDCARELASGAHDRWPSVSEYATKPWKLAVQLRSMFGVTLVEQCIGLNSIFVRAPSGDEYRKNVGAISRRKIEAFCLPRAARIISAVQPRRIVSIGFDTLDQFGGAIPDLENDKGRVLTKIGKIAGYPAIATLHLTGAHISNIDRMRIRDRILAA